MTLSRLYCRLTVEFLLPHTLGFACLGPAVAPKAPRLPKSMMLQLAHA